MYRYVKCNYYGEDPMDTVADALSDLGYSVNWGNTASSEASIDAYKYITKDGIEFELSICCYYYPYPIGVSRFSGPEKYLIDNMVKDLTNNKYITYGGGDFPNYRERELTPELIAKWDGYNMRDVDDYLAKQGG